MRRADNGEVASIECCHLRFAETLAERDDRGVDEPEVEILVLALQIGGPSQVVERESLQAVAAGTDVVDEDLPGFGTKELAYPVVDFDEDAARDDQVLLELINHRDRACVGWIAGVEEGQDRPRVENEDH